MADDWWANLFDRMFAAQGSASLAQSEGAFALGGKINKELESQEGAALPASSPSPSPSASASPAAPGGKPPPKTLAEAMSAGSSSALYRDYPDARVYLGTWNEERANGNNIMHDKYDTVAAVIAELNDWSEKKRTDFAVLAVAAGLIRKPTINFEDLEPLLTALAMRSAKLYERGIKITPWGLLERYGVDPKKTPAQGPVTTTSTSRTVNLSAPREASSLVDAALAQRLGRAATKQEKAKFLAALNAAEKREPATTTSTTTTTGAGTEKVSSDSSSTTSGGVNPSAFAEEWSLGHNKDEAGSFQALAEYMPAFYAALGAPV